MKLVEVTTCPKCPYVASHREVLFPGLYCKHPDAIERKVLYDSIPEHCPLASPQNFQLSCETLSGIFWILIDDMQVKFVTEARAEERYRRKGALSEDYSYNKDALLKMIEWAKENEMCILDKLKYVLHLIDNPNVEL